MILTKVPKPQKGWIYVKALKEEENKTAGGIYMPEQAKEMTMYARAQVLSVGGSTKDYTMECQTGDEIIINAKILDLSHRTLTVSGSPVFLLREETDVVGWVDNQDKVTK